MIYKALFIPDTHYPIQDNVIIDKLLDQVIPRERPNLIVHLGDLLDFALISRFTTDPRRAIGVGQEIGYAREFFSRLRKKAPRARIIFKEGNHEERLPKFLKSKAAELLGLSELELPELFHCKKNKVEYFDANTTCQIGNLLITHGWHVRGKAGYSAMGALECTDKVCGISGHTHRTAKVSKYNRWWIECGHIGSADPNKWEYMKDKPTDWQRSFAFGYMMEDGTWDLNPIWIDNKGEFILNGRQY